MELIELEVDRGGTLPPRNTERVVVTVGAPPDVGAETVARALDQRIESAIGEDASRGSARGGQPRLTDGRTRWTATERVSALGAESRPNDFCSPINMNRNYLYSSKSLVSAVLRCMTEVEVLFQRGPSAIAQ